MTCPHCPCAPHLHNDRGCHGWRRSAHTFTGLPESVPCPCPNPHDDQPAEAAGLSTFPLEPEATR